MSVSASVLMSVFHYVKCQLVAIIAYPCEVSIIVAPLLRIAENTFHNNRRAIGSIPVVGSSRKTIDGFPINAIPVLNFLLLPPLKLTSRTTLIPFLNSSKWDWKHRKLEDLEQKEDMLEVLKILRKVYFFRCSVLKLEGTHWNYTGSRLKRIFCNSVFRIGLLTNGIIYNKRL